MGSSTKIDPAALEAIKMRRRILEIRAEHEDEDNEGLVEISDMLLTMVDGILIKSLRRS